MANKVGRMSCDRGIALAVSLAISRVRACAYGGISRLVGGMGRQLALLSRKY